MQPSRSIALFALIAIVLLRGVGFAADAWTANAVDCCCGRHAADHDCGCDQCPSHHHGKRHDDHQSHIRSCSAHGALIAAASAPQAVAPSAVLVVSAPRAVAVVSPPPVSPEARVVHPETPPS